MADLFLLYCDSSISIMHVNNNFKCNTHKIIQRLLTNAKTKPQQAILYYTTNNITEPNQNLYCPPNKEQYLRTILALYFHKAVATVSSKSTYPQQRKLKQAELCTWQKGQDNPMRNQGDNVPPRWDWTEEAILCSQRTPGWSWSRAWCTTVTITSWVAQLFCPFLIVHQFIIPLLAHNH